MARYPSVNISEAGVTAVDCQKQVRSWQLLRSLMELLIPTCNCAFTELKPQNHSLYSSSSSLSSSSITGTIFGFRRGKVNFCIQTNSKSTTPILLLEMAVPTAVLAREMSGGILRIALESNTSETGSVLAAEEWTMYLNGRKVGFALKRRHSAAEVQILRQMDSVVEGAGIISGIHRDDDQLMYLRAKFDRVCASLDSESFHLRDPHGTIGQDLSIFFFRCSRS